MYLRQSWRDPRLQFTPSTPKLAKIRLGLEYYRGNTSIWIPDTFFRNEKRAEFHRITVDNRLMRLTGTTGSIWYVSK